MKLTRAKFAKVEKLINDLHNEQYAHAQGDNGEDVRNRRDKYRQKLEKLLTRNTRTK